MNELMQLLLEINKVLERLDNHLVSTSEALDEIKRISTSKYVVQLTLDGEYVNTFPYAGEAARETGIHRSFISSCCKNKVRTAGGFQWMYLDDYRRNGTSEVAPSRAGANGRAIIIYKNGELLGEYESFASAARHFSNGDESKFNVTKSTLYEIANGKIRKKGKWVGIRVIYKD